MLRPRGKPFAPGSMPTESGKWRHDNARGFDNDNVRMDSYVRATPSREYVDKHSLKYGRKVVATIANRFGSTDIFAPHEMEGKLILQRLPGKQTEPAPGLKAIHVKPGHTVELPWGKRSKIPSEVSFEGMHGRKCPVVTIIRGKKTWVLLYSPE